MFRLEGKVALITGGGGVLGSAIAKGLSTAGARVVLISRTKSKLEEKAQEISAAGGDVITVAADVLDKVQLENAKADIIRQWGRIDILINCAGGNMKGATIMPEQDIADISMDDFGKVTDLNLKGTVLPSIVFGQAMIDKQKGSIINVSSMAADRTITRVVGYSASKAAVNNFTKWLAVEMVNKYGEGIRVNAIAPGFFIADQNRSLLTKEDGSLTSRGQTIVQNTPMKRFGEPEELVSTVVWLCSDASSFVTGIVVPVDGGFSAFSGV